VPFDGAYQVWYHALSSSAGPADHDWRAGGAAAEEGRPYWLDWPAQWEAGHGPVLRARGCDDGGAAAAVGQLSQLSEGVRVYRSKGCVVVSAPSPSFARLPVLTDISLCHACSCQEILRVETARQGFQGMALQRRAGRLGLLEQPGAPETGWVAPHILRRRAPAPPAPVSGFEPTAPQYARPQAKRAVPPRPAQSRPQARRRACPGRARCWQLRALSLTECGVGGRDAQCGDALARREPLRHSWWH
jgi:hypothetical protein